MGVQRVYNNTDIIYTDIIIQSSFCTLKITILDVPKKSYSSPGLALLGFLVAGL